MSTSTIAVNGVDFIAVPTQDFEQADRFYGDVLGLERSKQWGQMPAREFEAGSLTIAVSAGLICVSTRLICIRQRLLEIAERLLVSRAPPGHVGSLVVSLDPPIGNARRRIA